ncbi:DUF4386 domain-containing protein [Micromonospora sp. KC207]|uniref:DUF4386 domain-containing protein n=1 Tax=Micromonospora sp. KC207 TaxID=2530377 RepID=UPI00352D7582
MWSLGLILFGVHLLMIGWLAWRSDAVPTWVAVLVAIAGAGYLADSIGALVPAAYPFQVAAVTFVGEVVLMVWLLVFAACSPSHRRSDLDGDRARQAQPRETGTRVGVPTRAMPLAGRSTAGWPAPPGVRRRGGPSEGGLRTIQSLAEPGSSWCLLRLTVSPQASPGAA